ncbi:protein CLEC16A-like [Mizuhopecten yessoensis]|uniref:protein CLEC16A-like n=1 Tax=Mizuhopecten yessoensis TaxID=6573 RepID=UPI000B45D406|nr:protein CLEC16A-like [Mizuhopecten yessoensis]
MFSRSKGWLPGLLSKPKNPHSLEHLKYLYNLLLKNQIVHEHNRSLLVETLRSISEILIWGDQNDSSVFDFFLEKNMLSFFLRYLRQKLGRFICVQLLQTLNILFENISNETSLYYLLSNNHINAIIVHRFDFSDEEVMAYYISFLKTLSLKLNRHTIHFFYNEHTNDFALYTEAIKFFNHSETMVRIAVRTITLNVFRVQDNAMLRYIKDRTAAPYFSNLVWFIGMHILDLDSCVRNDAGHQSRNWLSDLVAEHLDHLHYMNDILNIQIDSLNDVLTDQLLNRLLIPLYVYSLTMRKKHSDRTLQRKHVSSVVSLFLLSQVFLIISYSPLVRQLAEIIFQGDVDILRLESSEEMPTRRVRAFTAPEETLEKTFDTSSMRPSVDPSAEQSPRIQEGNSTFFTKEATTSTTVGIEEASSPETERMSSPVNEVVSGDNDLSSPNQNSTDEEKLLSSLSRTQNYELPTSISIEQRQASFSLNKRPYLESIFNALECTENDYEALFGLCLLYAMGHNDGLHQGLMDTVLMPTEKCETKDHYNVALVERLIKIITLACQHGEYSNQCSINLLHNSHKEFYKPPTQLSHSGEEIFLDMFEDEYREMKSRPINVEYFMMDASILLPPTGTPLTGIGFNKRLPCGEMERARRAIGVFIMVRDLSLCLMHEEETQLPLTKEKACVKVSEILDLNNSDLIACTIVTKERKQERRFLVIDSVQMILVEPDTKRLGWGVVRFVGLLQDVEVMGDKDDSRSLHINIHKPASSQHTRPMSLLSARFLFDDHIRCMAAKQRLSKGRLKARQLKMHMIERLLDIPSDSSSRTHTPVSKSKAYPGRGHAVRVTTGHTPSPTPSENSTESQSQGVTKSGHRLLPNVPDEAARMKSGSKKTVPPGKQDIEVAEEATSFAYHSFNQQTGGASPSRHSPSPVESQDIPLEDLSKKKKRHSARKMSDSKIMTLASSSHSRSHSHSPKRPEGIKPSRGRSTSLAIESEKRDRSSTPVRRQHSKSSPPTYVSSNQSRSRASSTSSDEEITRQKLKGKEIAHQSPKTLRPAEAPTLSLLPQGENGACIPSSSDDSPKLMAPAEMDRIRSLSDTSSTSSGGSQIDIVLQGKSKEDKQAGRPQFAYNTPKGAEAEVSTASVEQGSVARSDHQNKSTSDQLTKLAQIVQEHYKFSKDDGGGQQQTSLSPSSSSSQSTETSGV